jgi:hypothetical protein
MSDKKPTPRDGHMSARYLSKREDLPPALHAAYDFLVDSYRFYAFVHDRHPFVSYKVLASLILEGWCVEPKPKASD